MIFRDYAINLNTLHFPFSRDYHFYINLFLTSPAETAIADKHIITKNKYRFIFIQSYPL